MRAATGNRWRERRSGVVWVNFGRMKTGRAPVSSSLPPYRWILISPLLITNSASSPQSLWLHISSGLLDLAGSDAMALLMLRPLLLMDHGGLDLGPWLLPTIHTLIFIEYVVTLEWFLLYTWHLLLLSILERDPPLLLSWRFLFFSPWERGFLFLGSISIRAATNDYFDTRLIGWLFFQLID